MIPRMLNPQIANRKYIIFHFTFANCVKPTNSSFCVYDQLQHSKCHMRLHFQPLKLSNFCSVFNTFCITNILFFFGFNLLIFSVLSVFDIASRINNNRGEVSPSSLTTSEKSDNTDSTETNNTKNESGESDPGYESDGTKRRLKLQTDVNTFSSEMKEQKSSLNATRLEKNSLTQNRKDAKDYNESFSRPIVIENSSSPAYSATNEKSETSNNVATNQEAKNFSYAKNCNFSSNVSKPNARMFTKHSIVLPQKCHFSEKTDNVRNISVQSKTIKSGQHVRVTEKSHSNVLVIPIESDVKEQYSSPNDDEDIEVTSIFEDIIQSETEKNDQIFERRNCSKNKTQSHIINGTRRKYDYKEVKPSTKQVLKTKSSHELPNVTMKIFSPVVIDENTSLESSKALQSAFSQVDVAKLSTSYDFVLGLVKKENAGDEVSTRDIENIRGVNFRTIERTTNCDKFRTSQPEESFYDAKKKCLGLKRTLSRVKNEINDRKSFLEIIKEIASAIKKLLDSVNNAITNMIDDEDDEKGLDLEDKKKDFIRGSKRFSHTLKDYFRNGNQSSVIFASESLIAHVNEIMISLIAIL